jgi:hypothetical protein
MKHLTVGLAGRLLWMLPSLVLLSLPAGPVSADSAYTPFKVPREVVQGRVHTIALAPVSLPFPMEHPVGARTLLESLLAKKLESGGIHTVPSRELDRIWRKLSDEVGGVFDPVTGKPNDEKYKAVREHSARELQRAFHADAILWPSVGLETLFPYQDWFREYACRSRFPAPNPSFLGGNVIVQRVIGTDLNIQIQDIDGTELYRVRTCIEWTASYRSGGYRKQPASQLYGADVVQQAIDVALKDLLERK